MEFNEENTAPCITEAEDLEEIVLLLLQSGADINSQTLDGVTPLQLAIYNGRERMVNLLLSEPWIKKLDLEKNKPSTYSLLHLAVQSGNINVLKMILDKFSAEDFPVDQTESNFESTALHMAAKAGNCEMVELLISKKANINAKTNENATVVDLAVAYQQKKVVEVLIKHLAVENLNIYYYNGYTILQIAVHLGLSLAIVENLLQLGSFADSEVYLSESEKSMGLGQPANTLVIALTTGLIVNSVERCKIVLALLSKQAKLRDGEAYARTVNALKYEIVESVRQGVEEALKKDAQEELLDIRKRLNDTITSAKIILLDVRKCDMLHF